MEINEPPKETFYQEKFVYQIEAFKEAIEEIVVLDDELYRAVRLDTLGNHLVRITQRHNAIWFVTKESVDCLVLSLKMQSFPCRFWATPRYREGFVRVHDINSNVQIYEPGDEEYEKYRRMAMGPDLYKKCAEEIEAQTEQHKKLAEEFMKPAPPIPGVTGAISAEVNSYSEEQGND